MGAGLEGHQHTLQSLKNAILSINLDQNMPKMRYFQLWVPLLDPVFNGVTRGLSQGRQPWRGDPLIVTQA